MLAIRFNNDSATSIDNIVAISLSFAWGEKLNGECFVCAGNVVISHSLNDGFFKSNRLCIAYRHSDSLLRRQCVNAMQAHLRHNIQEGFASLDSAEQSNDVTGAVESKVTGRRVKIIRAMEIVYDGHRHVSVRGLDEYSHARVNIVVRSEGAAASTLGYGEKDVSGTQDCWLNEEFSESCELSLEEVKGARLE